MTTVKTLVFLLLLLSTPLTRAELVLHWESDFDLTEKQKLTLWVRNAHQAVENLVRPFPFSIDIHFHRAHSNYKPTRWANTIRSRRQGIRFYIDPSYSQQALLDDWVAYHEFSHLLIPYLGRDNTWFAEGFASFMQFQVMASSNVLTTAEKARAYQTRIDKARRKFDLDHLPFVDAAATLRSHRDYPTMYQGSSDQFEYSSGLQSSAQSRLSFDTMLTAWREGVTKSAGCSAGPVGLGLKRTSALFHPLPRVSRIPSECPKALDPGKRPTRDGGAGGARSVFVSPWMATNLFTTRSPSRGLELPSVAHRLSLNVTPAQPSLASRSPPATCLNGTLHRRWLTLAAARFRSSRAVFELIRVS